ncbi:uncharacterized protein J8A68_003794 [[Candida] subhashii]|uniref:Creatinase/aminopeptidase n=1 Tax=[Candida] subhashii TaxID=561895 RepID=A0A8J5QIN6_9ASCO|nr:uncharacterized protein J8A68_003794 [[Candida] subhashii]KAG7662664.1 hypothetical protein J8A68_003794 [[Candida] subhashii]
MCSSYSEKQPLLKHKSKHKRYNDSDEENDSEISTNTICPTFSSLISSTFQCFPKLTKHLSNESGEEIIDYSDDEASLPDLPYTVGPTAIVLPQYTLSQHQRLIELRKLMKRHNIGVYIIPSEDEHHSEYTALADKRREYISGFTGSAGIAVVTLTNGDTLDGEAALSTDGRYFLQAEKQLDLRYWKLLKQGLPEYPTWTKYAIDSAIHNPFSKVISCDPRVLSLPIGEYFKQSRVLHYLNKFDFKPLISVNLVDEVWGDEKPSRSLDPVYHLPLKYSGEHTNEKVQRVRAIMKKRAGTHYLVTDLDSVAWLFNLRADTDIPFNPAFFSYAMITFNAVILYINQNKIDKGNQDIHDYLASIEGLRIKDYEDFYHDASQLKSTIHDQNLTIILPTKASTTYALYDSIPESYSKRKIIYESIISNLKIFKNKTESFNAKIAQYKDSLAFIVFSSWLEHELIHKQAEISEYDAACKIFSIRETLPNFKGLSYETISSTGPNAAIIHYAPTKEENSIIDPQKIYLIDSGSQFLEGTTDITRSYMFDPKSVTQRYKKFYTLVLKGHLGVAMAKFPPNSNKTGTVLDSYSRQPLWNEGLDFNHGTGHGVGAFGNVHEGPLYISTTAGGPNSLDLYRPGAILSDEPGFYVDGELGIRIESELMVIECDDSVGKTRNGDNFLGFEYLTKVPFCRKLIDTELLSTVEINWINEYHKSIRVDFGDKLLEIGDRRAYNWLFKETEPI